MKLGLNIFPHDSDRKSGGSITTSRDRTQNPKPKNQTLNPKPDLPTAYCPKTFLRCSSDVFPPEHTSPTFLPASSFFIRHASASGEAPAASASECAHSNIATIARDISSSVTNSNSESSSQSTC